MRPLKKLLLVFALAGITSPVFAGYPGAFQRVSASDNEFFGVYFFGGYGLGMMRVGPFKEFAESYNSFYGPSGQNILDSEIKPFRTCAGYVFGGGIHIGPMSFNISYVKMESSTSVDIKGGNKRVFTHAMRIPARIGIGFDNKFVMAEFTTGFASPYLKVGYQYYDGRISYGRDRSLNGIYKTTAFTFGVNVMGKLPFAKIFALSAGLAVDGFWGFEYQDTNWNKIFWMGSPGYSQYMPTDVNEWSNNPSAYPMDKAMKSKGFSAYAYGGLTIQIN